MKPAQLRGLVYSAHADGYTYNRIAQALGISGREARLLDADTRRLIEREADKRFPLVPPQQLAAPEEADG